MSVPPDLLRRLPMFRRMSDEDRVRIGAVSRLKSYERADVIFNEGDASDVFVIVVEGRVKVFKATPAGKEVILEIFGPGELIGGMAVYESIPYPASAITLEPTTCVLIARRDFFELLERYPALVRGLLSGLSLRLAELTRRLAEMTGGRIEVRFARLFVKLADQLGRTERGGVFIPMVLSRQELADFTGTTIETAIRIMSRWQKEDVVHTEKDGFLVVDRTALDDLASA